MRKYKNKDDVKSESKKFGCEWKLSELEKTFEEHKKAEDRATDKKEK